MIYMFLSNNPSSGDINLLNLSCFLVQISCFRKYVLIKLVNNLTFTKMIGTLNTDIHLFS